MPSTGFQFPGTASGVWAGGNDWATPDNIKLDDALNAQWSGAKFPASGVDDGPSLKATNFGFSVPVDATITGIECKIEGRTDGNIVSDLVYLTELSVPINLGTAKRLEWTDIPTSAPQGQHVYGSSVDLWGATITPAMVNATNFGWIFMIYDDVAPLSCLVNFMQMNVHYTEAVAGGGSAPIVMMIGA